MFIDNVANGRPFKDYGAEPSHGEFTHRIQWYILSKNVFGSAGQAVEVYRSIAKWSRPIPTLADKHAMESLWNLLLDRAPNTTGDAGTIYDFRYPINLNTYLRKTALAKFPALGTFLQSRFVKRQNAPGFDWQRPTQAACLKLFEKVFASLSLAQANFAYDVQETNILSKEAFSKMVLKG